MTDLEELRAMANMLETQALKRVSGPAVITVIERDIGMLRQAADEIEKLRVALKDADKTISRNNSLIGKMAVAIKRLKEAKAS